MSIGNKLGNFNQTSDLDNIIVERISTRSLLQPITIKGDLDFESLGSIGNVLSVNTGNVNSLTASVATLTGNDISFAGEVEIERTLTFTNGVGINVGADAGDPSGATVAIGDISGDSDSNIVINATGTSIEATTASACYVKPIRAFSHGVGAGIMVYDPLTGEITYSDT